MTRNYLKIPVEVLDGLTVRLQYATASNGIGAMVGICLEARRHWRNERHGVPLPITADMLRSFRCHAMGGGNGVAWWVSDLVKRVNARAQLGYYPHYPQLPTCLKEPFRAEMPEDCGWIRSKVVAGRKMYSRDLLAHGLQPKVIKWKELERWCKAALIWLNAPERACELTGLEMP